MPVLLNALVLCVEEVLVICIEEVLVMCSEEVLVICVEEVLVMCSEEVLVICVAEVQDCNSGYVMNNSTQHLFQGMAALLALSFAILTRHHADLSSKHRQHRQRGSTWQHVATCAPQ